MQYSYGNHITQRNVMPSYRVLQAQHTHTSNINTLKERIAKENRPNQKPYLVNSKEFFFFFYLKTKQTKQKENEERRKSERRTKAQEEGNNTTSQTRRQTSWNLARVGKVMRAGHRQGGGVGGCSSGVIWENIVGSEVSECRRTHTHFSNIRRGSLQRLSF